MHITLKPREALGKGVLGSPTLEGDDSGRRRESLEGGTGLKGGAQSWCDPPGLRRIELHPWDPCGTRRQDPSDVGFKTEGFSERSGGR